ncbi:MAG: hypothetical protein HZB16_23020, partial [Armatimonadetes bacterium]|nr:hypothetical protein [Armatimonadota bacterium]
MRIGGWLATVAALGAIKASAADDASVPTPVLDLGQHRGPTYALAWTPDGRELVTGARDKAVRIWDAEDGSLRATLRAPIGAGQAGWISTVAISPDGRWLAVAGYPPANAVRIYDMATRRLLRVLPAGQTETFNVTFSPAGDRLAAAAGAAMIVWDTATWLELGRPALGYDVCGVSFSPDGKQIACGGYPARVTILDGPALTAHELAPLGEPANGVNHLVWDGAGRSLICTVNGLGHGPVLVDVATGAVKPVTGLDTNLFSRRRDGGFCALSGSVLRSFGSDGVEEPPRPIETVAGPYTLALSPSGNEVAVVSSAGMLGVSHTLGARLWMSGRNSLWLPYLAIARDGDALAWAASDPPPPGDPLSMEFSPDGSLWTTSLLSGRRVAASYPWGGVELLGSDGHRERRLLTSADQTIVIAVMNDERYLAARDSECVMRIWSLADTRPEVPPLLSLYVSPEGEWVAWTEEGYYACTPGAEQWVGWQINQGDGEPLFYRAAQFRDRFYRPDVIRRVLKCGSVAKAVAEADAERNQKTDPTLVASQMASFAPPTIEVTAPAGGAVFADNKIIVRAKLRDPNGRKIASAQVMVNGRAPWQGRFVFVPIRGPEEYAGPVELNPGENVISVTATNDAGAQTEPVSITVRYQAPE